ncbi:bifunctional glycosyltransferase/CDP-glycerol:glycerophosphate glycerophosphotransferase [Leucobacter sp. USHLN154]|uniref:bifunctional glycosyltransferase/CDP-glycerol:glycerophosphate glycerophosphotransferase n=1 Tax=Leucobacter sp. USHLN154 TaxID=3081269 RepID=UPI0030195091
MASQVQTTTDVTRNGLSEGCSPTLSVVIPCFNVAVYLPELFESLERQACDPSAVELVFVIDGSPDESEELIRSWMKTSKFAVQLLVKANGGVASARNAGTSAARGAWLLGLDPDDTVSPNYLEEILAAAATTRAEMIVTRLVRVRGNGKVLGHALDFKFADLEENTFVSLYERPEMIHLSGGTVVLKRDRLQRENLQYDNRFRVGFEDALLITRYLLTLDSPEYLIVPKAHLYYRVRPDSLVAQSSTNYRDKIQVVKLAYREILNGNSTPPPAWVANVLLYDLYWVFKQFSMISSAVFALSPAEQSEFNIAVREILNLIGLDHIQNFRVVNVPLDIRAGWEAAVAPEEVSAVAVNRTFDPIRGLLKVIYHSADPTERAQASLRGSEVKIAYHKAREIQFFETPWVFEHIMWLTVDNAESTIDDLQLVSRTNGRPFKFNGQVLSPSKAGRMLGKVEPRKGERPLGPRGFDAKAHQRWLRRSKRNEKRERRYFSMAYRAGTILGWRRKFRNAWVLIDRNIQANDNAEALYRHIRDNRPDINAWFVLNKSSADYKRLKSDGFKLVPHGSRRHFSLMKEARVLSSSMIDQYIVRPFPRKYLPQTWSFSFLQHGVTKDRLHRWFNFKDVDHFVTATLPETASIRDSPGPYKFSDREVTLTGFPRHDRLFELCNDAARHSALAKRIVFMPTWRKYLGELLKAENGLEQFYQSRFVKEWTQILNGEFMKELSQREDVEIVLLPHPGIDQHWTELAIPSSVRRASYVGDDVQQILAGASLVVTDYSSQGFEGAFCGAPSVYFQFDREEFFSGGHIGSPGYFDYSRDGFGPVCESATEFVRQFSQMFDESHPMLSEYRRRISNLYPLRDGKASERVVAAIEARLQPYCG